MTVGRDLLQTHFTAGVDGSREPRSEWSGIVDSAAARRALLRELGGWAREIADRTSHLTSAPTFSTAQAHADQQRFAAMHRGLAAVAAAIETAQDLAPVPQKDLAQLHAIPVNAPKPRRQPSRAETIAGLCQGITDTAERVRRAFAAAAPEAAWSPELTAASLRQTAASAAVISHHCQLIQRALAAHAPEVGMPGLAPRLRTSARAAGRGQAVLAPGSSRLEIHPDRHHQRRRIGDRRDRRPGRVDRAPRAQQPELEPGKAESWRRPHWP